VSGAGVPAATVKKHRRWSIAWLVPIAAAVLVGYLAYTTLAKRGPLITITFRTADGLQAQQTQVKYKAVALGTVESIELSPDMSRAIVRVRMEGSARRILTDHARFWVVRPRLTSFSAIESGLETLVSGVYIEVDPGAPGGREQRTFEGLEQPPGVRSDEPGRVFMLHSKRLGSLGAGAPVLYRDVNVGEVLRYDIEGGDGAVTLHVFVRSPYERFVHDKTRFWNASGIAVNVTGEGLHLEARSIPAILSGGIAFLTPEPESGPPSPEGAVFSLYEDQADAETALYDVRVPYVIYTRSSVQGLTSGSHVQMFGVTVGAVTDIRLVADAPHPAPGSPPGAAARIAFDLQPERARWGRDVFSAASMRAMVAEGLRVVVQSTSMLTGQKALALQYVPAAGEGSGVDEEAGVLVLPSQGGGLDDVSSALADVAAKLNQVPFDAIGKDIDRTLRSVDQTVSGPELRAALRSFSDTMQQVGGLAEQARAGMTPVLERLPAISAQLQEVVERANSALGETGYGERSDFQRGLQRLMDQMNGAARSIRLLADFLDRHPEALIRGRTQGASR